MKPLGHMWSMPGDRRLMRGEGAAGSGLFKFLVAAYRKCMRKRDKSCKALPWIWADSDLYERAQYERRAPDIPEILFSRHNLEDVLVMHEDDETVQRWRELRKAAGWSKETAWRQDVCRHTFATYHAAHFKNFAALQLEMGHRDSSLLRTRYVYAGNGTEASALQYFRV